MPRPAVATPLRERGTDVELRSALTDQGFLPGCVEGCDVAAGIDEEGRSRRDVGREQDQETRSAGGQRDRPGGGQDRGQGAGDVDRDRPPGADVGYLLDSRPLMSTTTSPFGSG